MGGANMRWWVLANVALVNLVTGGLAWAYIVVLSSDIIEDLAVDVGAWGALWSAIALGIFLSAMPGGVLGDRFGVRVTVAGGLFLGGGALMFRAAAMQFLPMLASMVVFGLALGLVFANLPKLLGSWFPARSLGLANGVNLAALGLGQGIAMALTPSAVDRLGSWRTLTQVLGLALLALAVYWPLAVREAPTVSRSGGRSGTIGASLARVFQVRDVWILALCYMLFLGGQLGAMAYLHNYFTAVRGLSREASGLIVALAPWSFVVSSFFWPALSDRIGRRKIVYVGLIPVSGLVVFAQAWLSGAPLALASAAWGLSAGAVGLLLVVPLEIDRIGPPLAGTAIGLITSAGFLGGVLFPTVGMSLAEARPVLAIAFFAACFLLSAALFALVHETGPGVRRAEIAAPGPPSGRRSRIPR